MLHILLMILKIIGIILLAILGILILLLLTVLLVPLRYEVMVESKGDLKATCVRAKFSWLLHLIAGHAVYENEKFDWKLRIAWKTIAEEEEKKSLPAAVEEVEEASGTETEAETKQEDAKTKKVKEKVQKQAAKVEADEEELEEEKKSEKAGEKESKITKIKYTMKSICDKIKLVIDFLEAEVHILALGRLKKEVIRLLKFLKPKRIKGNIHFGLEDPYHTGQILAALSVLYPFYGENVQIYPDFEEKILEGDLYVKGHVRGVYALIMAWNIIFDKHVRSTFKDIKSLL